jgi:uncharacterized protein involved in outer membrane biogenesis
MKKFLGILAGLVIVVIVGAGLYLYFSFSSLVKTAVETYAPRITHTKVTLGGVAVSLFGGAATLEDLVIGNPPGFKTDKAMAVSKASISLDSSTVMSPVIHIKEVQIVSPQVVFEPGQGSNNLSVLQKNIASTAPNPSPSQPANANAPEQPPKKLIIDHLVISQANATLALPQAAEMAKMAGQDSNMVVTLPTIDMRDLGTKEGGLPPAKIAEQVMARVEQQAQQAAAANAQKLMDNVTKGAGGLMNQGGQGVGDQLKGLLGK